MMNDDYWKSFARTGKIDDYLHYIACTKEESVKSNASSHRKNGGERTMLRTLSSSLPYGGSLSDDMEDVT